MDVRRWLRLLVAEAVRRTGPSGWRLLSPLPKIGKYAWAQRLMREPSHVPVTGPGPVDPTVAGGLASVSLTEASADAPEVTGAVQFARLDDARGRKVALIAHWDPDALIDPYVLYYADALKRLGWVTILASQAPVRLTGQPRELDAVVYRTCPGYDFTSWKAALGLFPWVFDADELLLTNDSIFAPVGDLGHVHRRMDGVDCDFWGLVESREKRPHLQSYYLVLRAAALRSRAFRAFWDQVRPTPDKELAIGCELGFTVWLAAAGLRPAAFYPAANQLHPLLNPSHCSWRRMLEHGQVPFVKRDLLFANPYRIPLTGIDGLLDAFGYPRHLIEAYAARRKLRPLYASGRFTPKGDARSRT